MRMIRRLKMGRDYELLRAGDAHSQISLPVYAPQVPAAPAGQPSHDYSREILRVLKKHWKLCLLTTVTFLAGLTFIAVSIADTYEAKARIEIEPPTGPETIVLRDIAFPAPDAQGYLQTQLEVLRSDALAMTSIQALQLEKNVKVPDEGKQPLWKSEIFQRLHLDRLFTRPGKTPMEIALADFRTRLTADQVRNSQLVEVR